MKKSKKKSSLGFKIFLIAVFIALVAIIGIFFYSSAYKYLISDKISAGDTSAITAKEVVTNIKIAIFNGCGEAGLADRTRKFLQPLGYDIVQAANYTKNVDKSFIIDWTGDTTVTYKLASIVGIAKNAVYTNIDSGKYLKASFIIGADRKNLKIYN
jgi:hypothetical protein